MNDTLLTNFGQGSFPNQEIEKNKKHVIIDLIQYVANAVVSKTVLKKHTGNITVTSFDKGEELAESISPFDSYIQIIDGAAQINIAGQNVDLKLGEGIVIPAHASHFFNAIVKFKMISTIIKSGYEI